ncbi:MAG: hypothetical protein ABEJ44_00625 [Halanaeroarchaeum sp.]
MSDWKFELDDVGPGGEIVEDEVETIEKGSPTLENVVFVLVGVVLALYVFAILLGFV